MRHFIQYQMKLLELVCDKLEIDYSEHKKKAWDINQKKWEEYQSRIQAREEAREEAQEQEPKPYKPLGMSDEEFERLLNITDDEYLDLQRSYLAACEAYDQKVDAIVQYELYGNGKPNPIVLRRLEEEKFELFKVKDDLSDSLSVADNNRKLREEIKELQ